MKTATNTATNAATIFAASAILAAIRKAGGDTLTVAAAIARAIGLPESAAVIDGGIWDDSPRRSFFAREEVLAFILRHPEVLGARYDVTRRRGVRQRVDKSWHPEKYALRRVLDDRQISIQTRRAILRSANFRGGAI